MHIIAKCPELFAVAIVGDPRKHNHLESEGFNR